MIPDLGVIIAAGGSSRRYGEKDKLTEILGAMPVFLHSIAEFSPLVAPGNLIVAARCCAIEEYKKLAAHYLPQVSVVWVPGGESRAESVCNALQALPLTSGVVAIHDAARPLATAELLTRLVNRARICGGAIAASKVVDSLKKVDGSGKIVCGVSRDNLYHAETPQVIDLKKYRLAYEKLTDYQMTDDAGIMLDSGFDVEVVPSEQWNMKLTSPEDLEKLHTVFTGEKNVEK